MTLGDANGKITAIVEGIGGRFAIIGFLSVFTALMAWMLKTEVDQSAQVATLTNHIAVRERENEIKNAEIIKLNDTLQQLEIRFGQLSQQVLDYERMSTRTH